MAKIPSFNESVQISGTSPVQAVSPQEAAIKGEALASFGEAVQKFGTQYGSYQKEKARIDMSIFQDQQKANSAIAGENAFNFIKTSPDLAPDGSDIMHTYDSRMQTMYDQAEAIQDPTKRKIAKTILTEQKASQLKDLYQYQAAKFNTYAKDHYDDLLNKATLRIMNDPKEYDKATAEYATSIINAPVSQAEKRKMMDAAHKETATALVNGYIYRNDFENAKNVLHSTTVGDAFDNKDRDELFKHIDTEQASYENHQLRMESLDKKALSEQYKQQQAQTASDLWDEFYTADSEEKRQLVIRKAEGALSRQMIPQEVLNAFESRGSKTLKATSDETAFNYIQRLKNKKSINTFVQDLNTAVLHNNITADDASSLFLQYSEQVKAKGTSKNKAYNEGMKISNKLLDEVFPKDIWDKFGGSWSDKKKENIRVVSEEAFKNRQKGMPPLDAMKKAMIDLGFHQDFGPSIKAMSGEDMNSPKALQGRAFRIQKEYEEGRKTNSLTPERKQELLNELRDIHNRQVYLKTKEHLKGTK